MDDRKDDVVFEIEFFERRWMVHRGSEIESESGILQLQLRPVMVHVHGITTLCVLHL